MKKHPFFFVAGWFMLGWNILFFEKSLVSGMYIWSFINAIMVVLMAQMVCEVMND